MRPGGGHDGRVRRGSVPSRITSISPRDHRDVDATRTDVGDPDCPALRLRSRRRRPSRPQPTIGIPVASSTTMPVPRPRGRKRRPRFDHIDHPKRGPPTSEHAAHANDVPISSRTILFESRFLKSALPETDYSCGGSRFPTSLPCRDRWLSAAAIASSSGLDIGRNSCFAAVDEPVRVPAQYANAPATAPREIGAAAFEVKTSTSRVGGSRRSTCVGTAIPPRQHRAAEFPQRSLERLVDRFRPALVCH